MPPMTQTSLLRVPTDGGTKGVRPENRRQVILEAAAALFKSKGFDGTSMREIATASGILPGSIYFHFHSKDDLLLSVQRAGLEHLRTAVESALDGISEPWPRLEAACIAHMEVILGGKSSSGPALLNGPMDRDSPLWDRIGALRDEYEKIFRQLVDDLPLPPGTNRKYLRLSLLGSINWTCQWYRPGRDSPTQLAVEIVWLYRCGLDPE